MTIMNDAAWLWAAKVAGAVAGSAVSLAYLLPSSRRDAAVRFAVGVVCGLVFGGTAGLKIATELGIDKQISDAELILMGSALASLCAWWALGFIKRTLEQVMGRWTATRFGPVAARSASMEPTGPEEPATARERTDA